MKKKSLIITICITLMICFFLSMAIFSMAQENPGNPKETGTPEAEGSTTPSTPAGETGKLILLLDSLSQARVYIEFFYMQAGDYPTALDQLQKDLNSILPRNLEKISIPTDPATGKPFVYKPSKDRQSYTISVPDPSAYGMDKIEFPNVKWGGFTVMAEDRKFRFVGTLCIQNIKHIATAIEFYAKDHKGKYPDKLKDLIPRYLPSMPICPITGKFYEYEKKGEDYYVKCPNPKEHKMEVLMFSTRRGWVTR